jgi:hypothetical protein
MRRKCSNPKLLRTSPHEKYETWHSRGIGNLENTSFSCEIGGDSPWGQERLDS